MQWKES